MATIIALLTGLTSGFAVYLVQERTEAQRAREANERDDRRIVADRRLENLRFVRERSSNDPKLPRPFIGLDLQGQALAALSLANAQFKGANVHGAPTVGAASGTRDARPVHLRTGSPGTAASRL